MSNWVKKLVKQVPLLGEAARRVYRGLKKRKLEERVFKGSKDYWEERYATGGDSGAGSYGKFAEFKASVLNEFVAQHKIQTVIEFGCGDGNQLKLAQYPGYLGSDVSESAISKCRQLFGEDTAKRFALVSEYGGEQAELALSLDVIFHLIEEDVFDHYMRALFGAASRFVIVYASDTDANLGYEQSHFKHRKFTEWVRWHAPDWELIEHIPNKYPFRGDYRQGSVSDFYIFARRA